MRAECKQHDILSRKGDYCDYAGVAEEDQDVIPIAHSNIFGGKLSLVDVDDLVLILQGLDGMREEDQRRRQRKTLHRAVFTELIMTR